MKETCVSDDPLIRELSKRLAGEIGSISESWLNNIEELEEEVRCLYEDNNNLTERLDCLNEQIDELIDCLNEQIDELNDKIYKIRR